MEPPLSGLRVIELAGIGPGQFGAMVLADHGAEVVRIDRAGDAPPQDPGRPLPDPLGRGRRSIALDLKQPDGVAIARELVDAADVLIDPFRPGVVGRLGLDPDACLQRNPGLVIAHVTGWGQTGPLAAAAGHDLNYTALAGALHPMGERDGVPPVPLNLLADFGGGGMYLAAAVVMALWQRERTGRGQRLDVAMMDGVATLMTSIFGARAQGMWTDERQANFLDGAAHFYRAYRTSDNRFVSIGAIEPQFYAELLQRLELDPGEWPQWDRDQWPGLTERLAAIIALHDLTHWVSVMEGTDVCFAPALRFDELTAHPHHAARDTFIDLHGTLQPAPALAFAADTAHGLHPPPWPGEQTAELLRELGRDPEALLAAGVAAEPGRSPGSGPRNLAPPVAAPSSPNQFEAVRAGPVKESPLR